MPIWKFGMIIASIGILTLVCNHAVLPMTSVTKLTQRSSVLTTDQTYACQLATDSITRKYYLNVSFSMATELTTHDLISLLSRSDVGLWYLYTNDKVDQPPLIYNYFWLTVNSSNITGNCSWYIGAEYEAMFACELKGSKEKPHARCFEEEQHTDTSTMTRPSTSKMTSPSISSSTSASDTSTDVTTKPTQTTTSTSKATSLTSTLNSAVEDGDDINTGSNASCLCPCACRPRSKKEFDNMLKIMVEDLQIPPDSLGQSKRKRLSATDQRLLSRGIGLSGALVLTVVFGLILAGDAKLLTRDARRMLCDLKRRVLP